MRSTLVQGTLIWSSPLPQLAANWLMRLGRRRAGLWPPTGSCRARALSKDSIIFGAPGPDPSVDSGRGSARLYSLDQATGALVWKSDVVAICWVQLRRDRSNSERIAYSSPLVHGDLQSLCRHPRRRRRSDPEWQAGRAPMQIRAALGQPFNFEATSVRKAAGSGCAGG